MLVKLARSIQIDRNHLHVICMESTRGRSVADKSRPVVLLGMGCKRMCHALNGTWLGVQNTCLASRNAIITTCVVMVYFNTFLQAKFGCSTLIAYSL